MVLRGADTMEVAARIADECARYRPNGIFIDGGGAVVVVDRCRQIDDTYCFICPTTRAGRRSPSLSAMTILTSAPCVVTRPQIIVPASGLRL
jgi:hypothetical protein